MSKELTKEQKLTALVMAAPSTSPATRAKNIYSPWCALERAMLVAGVDERTSLIVFAITLGFSADDARGIMTGWDEAAGEIAPFGQHEMTTSGYVLGSRLYNMVTQ